MKKVYLLPNLMTAFGLACGLFVIFRVALADLSSHDLMRSTVLLLFLAAISDTLDGLLARRLQAETDFGFQFDSLADAITFGVAPSVVILKVQEIDFQSQFGIAFLFASMVYSICAVLRLVRFNINEQGKIEQVADKHFVGLPVPAAALAVISTCWIERSSLFTYSDLHTQILAAAMAIVGYLMVSHWKFPSLKTLNFKVPRFHLAFTSVMFALLILYGAFTNLPLLIFLTCWLYIFAAVGMGLFRKFVGKDHQALKDFEPDDDE